MPDMDTIFALSTPPGRSGVAVVRVSGPRARAVLEELAPPLPEPRYAALRTIRACDGEVIDRALVLWFAAPATETGEDMAEFQLHGSRAVIAGLLETLAARRGLRPAEPGEFARRAFDNGKLDLTAVEGLADLVEAETAAQRRQALRQLSGGLGERFEDWRRRLIVTLALVEAGLDFADEADVPAGVWRQAEPEIAALADEMAAQLKDGRRGERIREGATIVVAGPPNAGKSSLLNALARRDVAIVSEVPGTTRDVIEVRLDLAGMAVTAVDTAGLREAGDAIEAEGVRRAEARIAEADLVLWVTDATAQEPAKPTVREGAVLWQVRNKSDLVAGSPVASRADDFAISALTGEGLEGLLDALAAYFREQYEMGADPVITRERHRRELIAAEAALRRAGCADYAGSPDLVAEELRQAATALGRVVGRIDVEDLLDVIFREFCIGK